MIISDLEHIELIDKSTSIFGSCGTTTTVEAEAIGDSTYTSVNTNTGAREITDKACVSIGRGSGLAIGDDYSYVDVEGHASGDITIEVELEIQNSVLSLGMVVAIGIDVPGI